MSRRDDLNRFYDLLDALEKKHGERRILSECHGRMGWPKRGIYFFFENGEYREDGTELRVVRVGTHAVSCNSKSKLWSRLRQHRGGVAGGGNHRGSIFRLHVGTATLSANNLVCATWGGDRPSSVEESLGEARLEANVSCYNGHMPFLWLEADDEPGICSMRKFIERNAIALLSNFSEGGNIDKASPFWLGHYCKHESVKKSGMWNVDHVEENYNTEFLELLECLILKHGSTDY